MRVAVAAVLAALLAAGASEARAAGPRLYLDRVDAQPSWLEGYTRLRLFVTAVKLEGSIIPVVGEDAWKVRLSGSLAREPMLVGHFGATGEEAAVVLVIERSFEYTEDLPQIRRAARQFVEKLPDRSRVAVLDYGGDVQGGHRLQSPGAAARRLDELLADPAPADPRLIDAMERAIRTLRRAEPEIEGAPLRRVVVVVSDGKDIDPSPERYREIGKRAKKRGVRIHSIAYSPVDNRRPLLGLGEMSKRSGGTFRWVRSREGFAGQLRTLQDEIQQQYVLTFLLPEEEVAGKRARVEYRDLVSGEERVRELTCGGESCAGGEQCVGHQCVSRPRAEGTGFFGWLLWIAGVIAGVLLLLLLIGLSISRAQARREARAQAALAAAGQEQTAAGASHRIVGVDPNAAPAGSVAAPSAGPAQPPRPAQAPASPRAPAAAPAKTPALFVVKGPGQGSRIPLAHGLLIGTAGNCHIRLEGDAFASGHHAQILMDTAGGCTIVDRGSTNGTFVNGVRTPQMRLKHGMLIKIGASELRFLET